jgi:peptidoglycan-associated lipoprotein
VPPAPPTEEELFARMSLPELNASRPLEDVFFDYDKSDLGDAARASLQKNADWLKRWTSTRVLVEGHADARGTSEYNLSLGERRAASVRDYLVSLGIDASRLSIVSKGEEEPVCSEENESCWSRNRRGHFAVTAK